MLWKKLENVFRIYSIYKIELLNLVVMVFRNMIIILLMLFVKTRTYRKSVKNIYKMLIVEEIKAIKPGPKPNKPDGKPDERRRVNPSNQPKHPDLKPHIHKPKD